MFSHIFLTSFVYIISIILAGLRPWYNWDYITQTPFEIYEKTSGRVQRRRMVPIIDRQNQIT